jgi:hypothetical protein
MRDSVSYTVTVKTPGRKPLRAILFDIEHQRVTEVGISADDLTTTFDVDCNWFMAVLAYGDSTAIAVMDLPERLQRGSTAAVTISLVGTGATQRCAGMLSAPSLGWGRPRRVTLPDTLELQIPESAASGFHRIQLTSADSLGCERFLEVG